MTRCFLEDMSVVQRASTIPTYKAWNERGLPWAQSKQHQQEVTLLWQRGALILLCVAAILATMLPNDAGREAGLLALAGPKITMVMRLHVRR